MRTPLLSRSSAIAHPTVAERLFYAHEQVRLPAGLARLCWCYAEAQAKLYELGHRSADLATRGIECNVPELARAKMGECIFCLEMCRNPWTDLHWKLEPDGGADLTVDIFGFDVKATQPFYRFLIWPLGKNAIFKPKKFDCLILTLVDLENATGHSVGWISKADFEERHAIAGRDHKLDTGTWHMDKDDLGSIDGLLACWRR